MTRIGSSLQSVLIREIANNRSQMNDLSRQLASGKVADSYGGLGADRTTSLALRQEKTEIQGFRDTISLVQTRVKVMDASIEQLRKNASSTRSQLLVAGFEPTNTGQTLAQAQAGARFSDAVDVLNTDIAGRHLFAGTRTDEAPVASPADILEGVAGKAGFRQVMDERRQADLGVDGKGRLALGTSGPSEITLSEDFAGSPFGFKLDAVRSSMAGVTLTGPAGAPAAVGVDFGAPLPEAGEKIYISLNLPDGTQKELALTASTNGDLKEGEFAIGVDGVATASSFKDALSSLLSDEASTTLEAASMQAAANDFFVGGTDTAQRVDGPPFGSATGLKDATDNDTVTWYTGDRSNVPARETSLARISEDSVVAYGARADEDAFGTMIKQFAILSSAVFDPSNDKEIDRYSAMTDRINANLGGSIKSKSLDRVTGELAIAQNSLNEADKRYETDDDMITGFLSDIETTDINEVAAKLLSRQTQLQASYQVTSMLSKLSLANFL